MLIFTVYINFGKSKTDINVFRRSTLHAWQRQERDIRLLIVDDFNVDIGKHAKKDMLLRFSLNQLWSRMLERCQSINHKVQTVFRFRLGSKAISPTTAQKQQSTAYFHQWVQQFFNCLTGYPISQNQDDPVTLSFLWLLTVVFLGFVLLREYVGKCSF